MAFKYDDVVPWGRNFDEYCRMFDLKPDDLQKKVIGCGDGPASFNCTLTARGGHVISVDPLYTLSKEQISNRIQVTFENVITQTRNNQDKFRWNRIRSVDELGQIRMAAMQDFLCSYESGSQHGRYVAGGLPRLPFADNSFDLALCSHFLFLYSDNLSYEFHLQSVREMLRVASEVRIFPLLDVNANRSPYMSRLHIDLSPLHIELRQVNYEFQIGGNEMMIIFR